jgi:diaminopimelate epimerase
VRTFERGVEDETYSCGTGVTAAALVSYAQGMQPPIVIETLGGRLQVDFVATSAQAFEQIFLIGPAQKVFEGQYFLTDL